MKSKTEIAARRLAARRSQRLDDPAEALSEVWRGLRKLYSDNQDRIVDSDDATFNRAINARVSNYYRDESRRRRRFVGGPWSEGCDERSALHADGTALDALIRGEELAKLRDKIEALSPSLAEALYCHLEMPGFPDVREVAARQRLSLEAIRKRVARGKRALRATDPVSTTRDGSRRRPR